jgi:putative N6-adenine-specific DNA methylase
MTRQYNALALCAAGAEKAVSNELKKLAARIPGTESGKTLRVVESGFGRVRFTADLAGLYRALFSLRAADRVLLEAASYPARDFEALFEGARAVRWDEFIPRGMGLHVGKVRTRGSALRAETSIQAAVHKAAADVLCRRYGVNRLPEAWAAKQAELRVYIEKDRVSLLIDLSGEPLFKRGYRREGGTAPLRETTAAAIVLLSGWKRKFPLYDPFCGSGTIAIEAALYAWNAAPAAGREFALNGLAAGDRRLAEELRREHAAAAELDRPVSICGSDADEDVIALAKANAARAFRLAGGDRASGVLSNPKDESSPLDFRALPVTQARPRNREERGFIITNPPYGRRLGDQAAAEAGYRAMASLADNFSGWKLALICDHPGFESHFGKKADSVRELKNGAVDTWLYEYETL